MEQEGGVGHVKEELEEEEKSSVVVKEEMEDSSLEDCEGEREGGGYRSLRLKLWVPVIMCMFITS